MLLQATYARFLGTPFTLVPAVAFRHDVSGVTPDSGSQFNEDAMQVGITLELDYQQRWKGILSYFNAFGAGRSNINTDRDFLGLSLSYAF